VDFTNFTEFLKKSPDLWKSSNSTKKKEIVETPRKEEKEIPAPQPTPFHKLSRMFMVWNISTGHLGLSVWLCSLPAPARLLINGT